MNTGTLRISRSRGAASGLLLVLLGAWGGLIAFVGPYFHYAYTPDKAWAYTTDRLWLEIIPAAATVLGGLLLAVSRHRVEAMLGAWLAALSGAWFVAGTLVSPLWNNHVTAGGAPVGTTDLHRIVEQLGFFTGVGAVIIFIAAVALGRLSAVAGEPVPVTRPARKTDDTVTTPTTSTRAA
jgi:hypothetical protein